MRWDSPVQNAIGTIGTASKLKDDFATQWRIEADLPDMPDKKSTYELGAPENTNLR